MPISAEAQVNIEIQEKYGVTLNPTFKYSLAQLNELKEIFREKKASFAGVKKLINEVTNAHMGGEIAPYELDVLVSKITSHVFPEKATN